MKVYFLSSRPCILTLNGAYFGQTDTFERFVELSAKDNVYAKFSPQGAGDIGFFINEDLRCSAPDGCDVYLLKDGIAVYAHAFPPTDFTLQVVTQTRLEDTLVTVYKQGELQLCIDSPLGVFNAPLPPSFAFCKVFPYAHFLVLEGENTLAVFSKKAERLLIENILSYQIDGELLHAVLPLSDRLGRTAECTWQAGENTLTQTKFSLKQKESPTQDVRAELLPYAFLESVLIGADFTSFLSEELLPKANTLKEFLGDFISVVLTNSPNVCALVYPKGERIFALRYFTIAIENGKITDVIG